LAKRLGRDPTDDEVAKYKAKKEGKAKVGPVAIPVNASAGPVSSKPATGKTFQKRPATDIEIEVEPNDQLGNTTSGANIDPNATVTAAAGGAAKKPKKEATDDVAGKTTAVRQPKTKGERRQNFREQLSTVKKVEGKDGPRYIVFLGNMTYKTKEEDVAKHFAKCGVFLAIVLSRTSRLPIKPRPALADTPARSIPTRQAHLSCMVCHWVMLPSGCHFLAPRTISRS